MLPRMFSMIKFYLREKLMKSWTNTESKLLSWMMLSFISFRLFHSFKDYIARSKPGQGQKYHFA